MQLFMLKGQPGCGKSTLGRALSTRLGWLLIDKELSLPAHHKTDRGDLKGYIQRIGYKADYQIQDSYLRLDTIRPLPDLVKEAIDWLEMRLK
ncbi:MAG TPA: hypothetical protein VFN23_10345 [Ktedonobacteraceae bacterium]|nr:hypothetical protein [Ktedonobacteraceae bacterium]